MQNKKTWLFLALLVLTAACVPISFFWIDPRNVNPEHREAFLPEAPPDQAWELVFADEFDGEALDEARWRVEDNTPRRDGWWEREAVSLDGEGHLIMSVLKDGERYIDGCITTNGVMQDLGQPYGFYTIRVKLHTQEGHWPAFWMMAGDEGRIGNGGRDGAEIDIFEKPTLDDFVQQTIHWDGYEPLYHRSAERHVYLKGAMDGWHTFSLWWTPTDYIYYIDGVETWRHHYGGVCQLPGELIISDEIGAWGGDITKAVLPDAFQVDYVRVYHLRQE